MNVTISRPPGIDVSVNNPNTTIYLKGNESTDGSIRYQIIQADGSDITEIQLRVDGLWQPTSFKTGSGSVLVGVLLRLSAAGNNLITTDGATRAFFNARAAFQGGVNFRSEGQASLATIFNITDFTERGIFRSDESSTFTGTLIENITLNNTVHLITGLFYFKTGATAATEPVRIEAWDGTDDTGLKIFDQTYIASEFPADTEITLTLEGFLEFDVGADTFTRISSDADFSLKGAPSNDAWWLAVDFSTIKDDDLLQTTEWETGDNFEKGQWTTQDRKVYVCNVTGIQTGTFDSNLDKWDLLMPVTRHDRQDIIVDGPITTTSTTFVDIPGAELTTKDLGEAGNYQVWISLGVQQSNNNSSITFRTVIDGVAGEGRSIQFGPNMSNQPQHSTLIGQSDSVIAGKIIKFQWLVSNGTGQINNMRIMIDGIPESRLV